MAVYYLAKDGNDNNLGGITTPWLTFNYSTTRLVAGDTLYVRGGVYTESLLPSTNSGTLANPITICNYPNEKPIIRGNYLITLYKDYIYVSGFELDGTGGTTGLAIWMVGNNCKVSYCYVHDYQYGGILVAGDYGIVEYCEVTKISLYTRDNGGNNASAISAARGRPSGTIEPNVTQYAILRHNLAYNTWGEGVSCFESRYTILEDNVTYNHWSACLYVSDSTDCLCQRNLVYQSSDRDPLFDTVGLQVGDETYAPESARNTFINNIVYGCRRNLLFGKFNDVVVANNIFVNSTYFASVHIWNGQHGVGEFKNNIIIQEDSKCCIECGEPPLNPLFFSDVVFENNLYNKTPASYWGIPYTTPITTVSDIINDPLLCKQGSLLAGELTANYFKLQKGSPAVDAGVSLAQVVVDYYEVVRGNPPILCSDRWFRFNRRWFDR